MSAGRCIWTYRYMVWQHVVIYVYILFYHVLSSISRKFRRRQAGCAPNTWWSAASWFVAIFMLLLDTDSGGCSFSRAWQQVESFFCRFKRFAVSCHFLRTASFPLLSGAGRFRSFPPPGRMSKLTISRFVRNQMLVAVNGDISIYTLYITLGYIKELIQGSLSLIYVWTGSLVQT